MRSPQSLVHWSTYWQAGAKHSLPQDFTGNYDRELAEFWYQQLGRVSRDGRVLDVCTGTGAIALLAAHWARENDADLQITGLDGAAIQRELLDQIWPDSVDLLEQIEFRFSEPLELLDVSGVDHPIDLITSQYGLEYCDLDKVASVLAVLLKPGGRLAMVTHGADSEMATTMQHEARDYAVLVEAGYFKLLSSWSKKQVAGQDLLDRLERVSQAIRTSFNRNQSALLAQVLQTNQVMMAQPMGQLLSQHAQAGAYLMQLEAAQARLSDMLRVTEKVAQGEAWLSPLLAHGLVLLEQGQIMIDGEHAAGLSWVLEKPA